jgi:predicted transcriptional regulator
LPLWVIVINISGMTFETELAERSLRADQLVQEGRARLRQLVVDAHRHGLSQRQIAALTHRSQPEVSRLLREVGGPARTWMTARSASEAIKVELQRGDEDFALRTLITAINDFRDLSHPAETQEFLRRPRPTGDRRWDTLLAAAVARACRRRGLIAPKWTRRAPLETWWFPAGGGGLLAARTMARTPIDFSRLGIWLDESAFQTA